jgi:hypothetical protein
MTPDLEDLPADRRRDRAAAPDRVDGAHVVAVPLDDGNPRVEVHAQRRAVERPLDVVDGQRVPREHRIDEAARMIRARCSPAARVDHHRSGDGDDPSLPAAHLSQELGDLAHRDLHALLGGNVARHEDEVPALTVLEGREDGDAAVAADDPVAALHVAQLGADRATARDHDAAVHPLARDLELSSPDTDARAVVRRRIEIVGDGAVLHRSPEDDVSFLLQLAAEGDEVVEDQVEPAPVRRLHGELDRREVADGLADVEAVELIRAAVLDDDVEILRHHPGVDEVAGGREPSCVQWMPISCFASSSSCFTFATFSFAVPDALRPISSRPLLDVPHFDPGGFRVGGRVHAGEPRGATGLRELSHRRLRRASRSSISFSCAESVDEGSA